MATFCVIDVGIDSHRTGARAAIVLIMGATESTRPEDSSKSEDGETVANEESANVVQDGESIDAKVKINYSRLMY